MKIIPLLILSASALQAAPSTDLGAEIQVPLEFSNAFALIHKESGNIRIVAPGGGAGNYTSSTYHSNLIDITGATSGFFNGSDEIMVLASPTSNRIVNFNVSSGLSTPLFLEDPAPQFPVYVKQKSGSLPRLFLSHTFNDSAPALIAYSDPTATLTKEDINGFVSTITSFQPFFDDPNGSRFAAGVMKTPSNSQLFIYKNDSSIDVNIIKEVPDNFTLTTNIRREDNRLCIIGHVKGASDVTIFSMTTVPKIDDLNTQTLPDNIGSIAPTPQGHTPAGVLITSADGTQAFHYVVTTSNILTLVQSFKAPKDNLIHGLIPVPGQGIMLLSGKAGEPADSFERMVWDGSAWILKQQEFLSGLGSVAAPDFATLFWFDAEPMVNPSAQLLQLEVRPDWTMKQSSIPIPTKIYSELYTNSQDGLDNPILFSPSPPSGAAFLMTNQLVPSVSLSTLGSTLKLTLPPLKVSPSSGTYTAPVSLDASTSEDEYNIFYRDVHSADGWKSFKTPITVSYSSTWQFFAQKPSGPMGPIVTRHFSFDPTAISKFDSDGDSIPDFVEIAHGLNPNGGVDTDADGYSDLDELLNGSDPTKASSTPASSTAPFNGQGFRVLAQAKNHNNAVASNGDPTNPGILTDGVPLDLHGMTSNLLASAPTEALPLSHPLIGNLAASFQVKQPVPAREWIILNTPQYFDINGSAPETRSGREIYKVLQRPVQSTPPITPALTGNNLTVDAATWLAEAASAYGSYTQVSTLTLVNPSDTSAAVILEAALYDALRNLTVQEQSNLGVPQDLGPDLGYNRFTLFGGRSQDASRSNLSAAMRDALLNNGLSFPNLISGVDAAVENSPNILSLTNELYTFHVAHSNPTASSPDLIPLLPLPLDVLRTLVRGGNLPSDYSPATTPARITAAKAEMTTALATLANAYRPITTWTIEVSSSASTEEAYSYLKASDSHLVAFYEADGDRYSLDQGMGIADGTRFSVTGYTDVESPNGYDGMELLTLNVLFIPLASDTDSDANLLADDWEKFFFGETGAVDPFAKHPINGYTYLQLYLLGHDPRSDNGPSQAISILFPTQSTTTMLPSGNMALHFKFPDDYVQFFEFIVQESAALSTFNDLPSASSITQLQTNHYQIDLGPGPSSGSQHFFRLYIRLKND